MKKGSKGHSTGNRNSTIISKGMKNHAIPLSMMVAFLCYLLDDKFVYGVAEIVSEIFVRLLKCISMPLIFFSIVSTIAGMQSKKELRRIGGAVLSYTLLTTFIAAIVAMGFSFILRDVIMTHAFEHDPTWRLPEIVHQLEGSSIFYLLMQAIPTNLVQPFMEENALGVFFITLMVGFATLSLPEEQRKKRTIFSLS